MLRWETNMFRKKRRMRKVRGRLGKNEMGTERKTAIAARSDNTQPKGDVAWVACLFPKSLLLITAFCCPPHNVAIDHKQVHTQGRTDGFRWHRTVIELSKDLLLLALLLHARVEEQLGLRLRRHCKQVSPTAKRQQAKRNQRHVSDTSGGRVGTCKRKKNRGAEKHRERERQKKRTSCSSPFFDAHAPPVSAPAEGVTPPLFRMLLINTFLIRFWLPWLPLTSNRTRLGGRFNDFSIF